MDDYKDVPYHLLHCPDCLNASCHRMKHPDFSWARRIMCTVCSPVVEWIVCAVCDTQVKHLRNKSQIQRHHYQNHKEDGIRKYISFCNTSAKHQKFAEGNDTADTDVKTEILDIDLIKSTFSREENMRFFAAELSGNSAGISYLISRACFNDDQMDEKMMDPVDVELNYLLSKLCLLISKGERDLVGQILYLITHKFTSNRSKSVMTIELPQSLPSLRQRFMDGSFAVLPNLPHPEIKTIGDFSYVSLMDIVSDLLAHGVTVSSVPDLSNTTTNDVNLIIDCKSCQNMFKRSRELPEVPDLVLCITEWSDGFQPNSSTKQNRGSVYCKTVSFPVPHKTKWSTSTYTYCVALGPAKCDTNQIDHLFTQELLRFQRSPLPQFYSREKNRIVTVYLELICTLQDQPERRTRNYLAYGNSNYHARWSWSCDFKSLTTTFPSCDTCKKFLLETGKDISGCDRCLNWNLPVESLNELSSYNPPKNFPQCSTTNGKLYPFQLTYDKLKNAISIAHQKTVDGTWKPTVARSFLSVHCLSTESVKTIVNNALNCKLLRYAQTDNANRDDILQQQIRYPHRFQQWSFPSLWCRNMDLKMHIETIMHLLFLGGTKNVMTKIHDWLKTVNRVTAFQKCNKDMFESVQRVGVSWCKCQPYGTGSFGPHVSENYLACCRLLKWFYQTSSHIINIDDESYEEPDMPHERWTKVQNVHWLRFHGLDTSGNAATVRLRVAVSRDNNELQNINNNTLIPEGIKQLEKSVVAWVALISRIMQNTMNEELRKEINLHVKIFLNYYGKFEQLQSEEKLPVWIRNFNYLSLLNLTEAISQIGPLRNVWEGGVCGENIIAYIKPEICMGLRKNFACSVLRKVMRKKSFDTIDQSREMSKNSDVPEIMEKNAYKKYSGIAEVKYLISKGTPLSCVIQNCEVFVVLSDDTLLKVNFGEFDSEVFSLCYFSVTLSDTSISNENISTEHDYGLLLPKKIPLLGNMVNNPLLEHKYTVVSRSWMELDENNRFRMPKAM